MSSVVLCVCFYWVPSCDCGREKVSSNEAGAALPKSIWEESYRGWKLGFVKWILEMREVFVAESLLQAPFTEALKGGEGGVHDALLLVDPRILMFGGRPKGGFGPGDPGCLSGVVWYVEDILDPDHMRRKHEYGKTAKEAYLKYRRRQGRPAAG